MSGVNPQGCQVFSFKHPSGAEREHVFLLHTTRDLPARGRIGIFNRSYYEEVLIIRVHPELLSGEALVDPPSDDKTFWHQRYRSITDLERHLHANGTRIVKFFLHLSGEEQRKRFLARIDEPEKNWKFSTADIKERGFWKEYSKAYEESLSGLKMTYLKMSAERERELQSKPPVSPSFPRFTRARSSASPSSSTRSSNCSATPLLSPNGDP